MLWTAVLRYVKRLQEAGVHDTYTTPLAHRPRHGKLTLPRIVSCTSAYFNTLLGSYTPNVLAGKVSNPAHESLSSYFSCEQWSSPIRAESMGTDLGRCWGHISHVCLYTTHGPPSIRHYGRVVKATDSNYQISVSVSERRFKSCWCRFCFHLVRVLFTDDQEPAILQADLVKGVQTDTVGRNGQQAPI